MAKREKFGKFVLLEQVESSALASEHRAAKLGATGLEKVVSVHRLTPRAAANSEVAKSLMDQVKFASQLQNPNILKIYGIGKVDSAYYISHEFLEAKSLRHVRPHRQDRSLSVDHTLLIVSKVSRRWSTPTAGRARRDALLPRWSSPTSWSPRG